MIKFRHAFPALACVMAMSFAGAAIAQAYPSKPVTIVAPFPPGGAADLLARLLGEKLSTSLGQTFVVDNRPGAGGTVGAAWVARAPADGYVLLLGVTATQTIAPSIYKKLPYDPAKDFSPISTVAHIPVALVVNASVKATDPASLIALAKSAGRPMSFASSGIGAIPHLTAEIFQLATSTKLTHVPYKGASPAMTDLLGGRVDLMFDHLPSVLPHMRSGKLRALAIAGPQRARTLPELPTLAQAGVPGVEVNSWFGLLAPTGTPQEVVTRLNQEVQKILATEEARTRLHAIGAEPYGSTPQEFVRLIAADASKWAKLVQDTGITIE